MKLFLTSGGLGSKVLADTFVSMLDKKPQDTVVAFIPTAADPDPGAWWIEEARNELIAIGTQIKEVSLEIITPDTIYSELASCDVIFVNGGNTFYLLDRIRKSGFDKVISKILEEGKLYVGISAGSIVPGPSIEVSGWEPNFDPNDVKLTNFTGLNLVPFTIAPHFTSDDKKDIKERSKEVNYPIFGLNNSQAIVCIDGKYKLIGEGEKILFNDDIANYL